MVHDVTMMYEAIKETIGYMKRNMERSIQKVHYFSDECAGQYKNCKNFLNVCHHKEDFPFNVNGTFLQPVMASHLVMSSVER